MKKERTRKVTRRAEHKVSILNVYTCIHVIRLAASGIIINNKCRFFNYRFTLHSRSE